MKHFWILAKKIGKLYKRDLPHPEGTGKTAVRLNTVQAKI